MGKYNSIIQLAFSVYIIENWIEYEEYHGLRENADILYDQIYHIIGKKLKTCYAITGSDKYGMPVFKPEIVDKITKASEFLSGRYELNNSLVLGAIQCILINCYEISGVDLRREIKIAQELCENCVSIIDYDFFNETDSDVFIEISEYLNDL